MRTAPPRNRRPGVGKLDRPDWMAGMNVGLLPCQLQRLPAEKMETAIEEYLKEARGTTASALKAWVHARIMEAKARPAPEVPIRKRKRKPITFGLMSN